MSGVITLDLDEVADEWRELLDCCYECGEPIEADPDGSEGVIVHDRSLDNAHDLDEDHTARPEECSKYEELCGELGITPVEPDTLRWYNRENNPTLIREDTFEEYAQEFAEDVHGDGVREMSSFINWRAFADGLRIDYYSIEYDGHTWLRRA